ncbi:hypothetical protein K2173_001312 [Erythroxylum novogranatense]|uniref:Uncharacterized protein n=1 Tax=Erythroxylum novogranatense TaxID=1862640 RepID=A0AAV8T3D5_9ROSI|nr:hypothetical protein K2173_001312 [Erythroxylum novogranatense]
MELLSKPFPGTWKRYWRRKRYQRIDGAGSRKNTKTLRLGGPKPRRVWKIKAVKLRLRLFSPLKLWNKLKNAYVDMMLSLAGNAGYLSSDNVFGSKRIPKARQVIPVVYSNEEVENRLIYEIYKALEATRDLAVSPRVEQPALLI